MEIQLIIEDKPIRLKRCSTGEMYVSGKDITRYLGYSTNSSLYDFVDESERVIMTYNCEDLKRNLVFLSHKGLDQLLERSNQDFEIEKIKVKEIVYPMLLSNLEKRCSRNKIDELQRDMKYLVTENKRLKSNTNSLSDTFKNTVSGIEYYNEELINANYALQAQVNCRDKALEKTRTEAEVLKNNMIATERANDILKSKLDSKKLKIDELKARVDILTGWPTETEKDIERNLGFIDSIKQIFKRSYN